MDSDSDMMWDLTEPDYDEGHWTTRDGKRLDIREMETLHIKNTINMLKRSVNSMNNDFKNYYEEYFNFKIEELEKELRIRDVYSKHLTEDCDEK